MDVLFTFWVNIVIEMSYTEKVTNPKATAWFFFFLTQWIHESNHDHDEQIEHFQ